MIVYKEANAARDKTMIGQTKDFVFKNLGELSEYLNKAKKIWHVEVRCSNKLETSSTFWGGGKFAFSENGNYYWFEDSSRERIMFPCACIDIKNTYASNGEGKKGNDHGLVINTTAGFVVYIFLNA